MIPPRDGGQISSTNMRLDERAPLRPRNAATRSLPAALAVVAARNRHMVAIMKDALRETVHAYPLQTIVASRSDPNFLAALTKSRSGK